MKGQTIRALARELGVDDDDVLLALWECGLTQFNSPDDLVYTRTKAKVRRVLGLPSTVQLVSPEYWCQALELSVAECAGVFDELHINMRPGARRLPRGAVKKLRARLRSSGIEPLPGCMPEQTSTGSIPAPFEWLQVGAQAPVRYLDADEVEQIHWTIAEDFKKQEDPIYPAGVRDGHLLGSAVCRPQTSLGGQLKYPTIEMAGAALLHSLVLNHPFHNGNKRTALVALIVFLEENGCVLTCDERELFRFVLLLARHALINVKDPLLPDREVLAGAQWLRRNSRPLDRGERRLKWWRLKRNLLQFDCTFEHPNRGNRINIERVVEDPKRFRKRRVRHLSTQVAYRDEGTDVDHAVVVKVRRDLELTPDHGVDSTIFYGPKEDRIDEWVDNYRGLLTRLSKR